MATESTAAGAHPTGLGRTSRTDRWWVQPALVLGGLSAFALYATWAAFQGRHYYVGPYLSPFYSPVLFTDLSVVGAAPVEHAWFGTWPSGWPSWLPASPALLILAGPLAMRFTCYYYRKAYYRAFAMTPPACAVGGIRQGKYQGETQLLLFQNLHRYAMYPAMAFVFVLVYDAVLSFSYQGELGFGLGSLVLLVNATLIGGYTFGCHSFRHLIGGRLNCFSCSLASRTRHRGWRLTSRLNAHHPTWAWASLIWVACADVYVRLASSGVIHDPNTWGF